MLIIRELSDEELAFVEIDEGSSNKAFRLRDLEINGKQRFINFALFVVFFLHSSLVFLLCAKIEFMIIKVLVLKKLSTKIPGLEICGRDRSNLSIKV